MKINMASVPAKARREAYEKFLEHVDQAIETLRGVMEDPLARDMDRIRAASEILDRGLGKSINQVQMVDSLGEPAKVFDEERLKMASVEDLRLMLVKLEGVDVIDAEVVEEFQFD